MGSIYFALFVAIFGACSCMNTWEVPYGNLMDYLTPDLYSDWVNYKKAYNKTYDGLQEELTRRLYWEDTTRYIREHNAKYEAGETTFYLGENFMADMAEDEVRKTYLSGLIVPDDEPEGPLYPEKPMEVPLGKDWRSEGYVTPVKSQGSCGSCWTFSAAGALEGMNKRKTGRLVDLSEQNLLDCAKAGNYGCRGGWMNNAFSYVKQNGGINSEQCYPYRGVQYSCSFKRSCIAATERGYSNVRKDERSLAAAVAHEGPIAIATDANHRSFMYYRGGLYYEPYCRPHFPPTHAMTLVGYGTSSRGDTWIVKNSWGTNWGQAGYVFMARNKNNNCRIASYASFPTA